MVSPNAFTICFYLFFLLYLASQFLSSRFASPRFLLVCTLLNQRRVPASLMDLCACVGVGRPAFPLSVGLHGEAF